jgi:uncharacterized protein YggE
MRFLLIAVAMLAPVIAQETPPAAPQPFVRAQGEGVVTAKPDEATINIGVVTQAATAEAAASQNASQANALIGQMKKLVGADGEVRTINYSVNPDYNYPSGPAPRSPKITGYTATNTVQVITHDLANIGKLIDAATGAGANHINGIQFSLRNEQAARAQALKEAAQAARANAEAMASALGVRVIRLRSAETSFSGPIRPVMAEMMGASRAATPVEPGAVEIRATVTVTLEVTP